MESGERMDIFRKKRSESSRKPRLGGSHTFMNEHDHSSVSGSPPSDPQSTSGFDKGLNEDAGKYTNHYSSHGGDDYKRKLGNGNMKGRFEVGKEDLGKSKSGNRKALGGGRDDDWDDIKRVRREVTELNGNNKHKGMEEDRIYDRKYDRAGGLKLQDYDRNRRVEKSSREKIHRDVSHHDKNFKENSMVEKGSERDRKFFGETFKRKMRTDDLDVSKRSRDAGKERKDSYDRHVSHEKSDRDRDCDQDRDRNHDGASRGRSHDVQGNSRSGDFSQRAAAVGGLTAVVGSLDWRNSDGHKIVDRRSSDAHPIGQVKGGPDSGHGAGHARSQDGGRNVDGHHTGQSKSANPEFKAPESLNAAQVKTAYDGKAYDIRESFDKSTLKEDDPPSKENRTTTVKLKVSGITHTIHASLAAGNKQKAAEGSAFARPPQVPEGGRRRQRLILQENSDDEDDYPPRAEKCIQESLRKESPANCSASARMDMNQSKEDRKNKLADESTSGKQVEINNFAGNQPVRKSSRIPKKRVLDGEIDEDEDTEEASQRKNLRTPKKRLQNGEYDDREEGETLQRKSSRIPKKRMLESEYDEEDEEDGAHFHKRKQKKLKSARDAEDLYEYEEEVATDGDFENSDIEPEGRKNGKRKETLNSTIDEKKEIPLTARQRAMQSSKDMDTEVGANLIEFPEGLPHSGQRRKKEKLSEVEQQLKKAEAAQRRKQQVERAANAQQAEAIKKILGTDSTRKKKEDKLRKQRDEKEQEKSASAMILAPNSVRWVMGPSGTVVSFAQDAGLPSIFNSAPCRYPPAREKCAGPLCNNTYKYRDSKSNLPLCSLQCYRAIHDVTRPVSTF
ncbi:uncharacterized protein LOC131065540 [Cryptomeria japonica]|uniref:uncharacterized protein LOC131065540 n=1 Tax=Cryptomeria japonica TaxID=3369 RepID=UPI0027DA27CD|nr:uncharacterized protein LOC131065540 [Cryptomeria japonica]XP_057856051.2 uncharacterized protein LOC131065540 [Cryptomeria japonica]XP_057856052.2 uncharacterized protein LOC131065540 [Cryptomeria japonica]XP_057856053.2 uncharacterized protein LOC131065540 [Cryptomeria japonica]